MPSTRNIGNSIYAISKFSELTLGFGSRAVLILGRMEADRTSERALRICIDGPLVAFHRRVSPGTAWYSPATTTDPTHQIHDVAMTPTEIEKCRADISQVLTAMEEEAGHPYAIARELLAVCELKVCLEFACEHVGDDNLSLPDTASKLLVDLCRLLGVDSSYYFYLTDHPPEPN